MEPPIMLAWIWSIIPESHYICVELTNKPIDPGPKPLQTTHYDSPDTRGVESNIQDQIEPEDNEIVSKEIHENNLLDDLLQEWGIGETDRKAIIGCNNIEKILELDIDGKIKDIVLRWNNPLLLKRLMKNLFLNYHLRIR